MKQYVLTFVFNEALDSVWLIRKIKPKFQEGYLNGIGGKIEKDESPHEAAIRELHEESGYIVDFTKLIYTGQMKGEDYDGSMFEVYVFYTITDTPLKHIEDEPVNLYPLNVYKDCKPYQSVRALIELNLMRINAPHKYDEFIIYF